ncbi:succinylglutamate desuccinylase/aspartoacylase domain-containing protein [Ectothiorhodospira lacustris]|uniref:succinylglutamate desuccinylase/aspartoacylase domain-containing protein n=1 Tax=Ectothiorhodospira lacustris TaxID=2899127 RepID=UPI001EE95C12|nr:succinylglutamate desuccinylase/aspartoacylase family protein [Ectothiorhodospira lacustris]MCG5499350.1 succinylglutamate desuccinylase/aspartoacylase family protein [Ectothiorhodospira lacustris]MCG5509239.1 succinylglutamate desuccinylase/aspartoacylase family protein [Ectothiorhodospira lacustris]MCG5521029.1 succinylglutamate desuccinylase/aspartoacylase family protein [Ectothiorhodospira lacustris]
MTDLPTLIRSVTYHGLEPGGRLIVLGAVHGNETCGTRGIERVMAELDSGKLTLDRGLVTFVPVTNPLAFQLGQRMGDRNLNRNFRISDTPLDFEDRIANRLGPLLARHDVLLDLHSFHTPGEPFVMLGPRDNAGELEPFTHAAEEEALARRLGARRIVEGWLDTYARGVARRLRNPNADLRAQMLSTDPSYGIGTTEFMRAGGGYALTLECGQHEAPEAPAVAYQAIINTLAHLQLVDSLPAAPPGQGLEVLKLVEVIDRDHPEDRFSRDWTSFDPIRKGDEIGRRHDGTSVSAPADGFIVFPNPNALPGNEWFYLAEASERMRTV